MASTWTKAKLIAQLQAIENNAGVDVNADASTDVQINSASAGAATARIEALLCIIASILVDIDLQ